MLLFEEKLILNNLPTKIFAPINRPNSSSPFLFLTKLHLETGLGETPLGLPCTPGTLLATVGPWPGVFLSSPLLGIQPCTQAHLPLLFWEEKLRDEWGVGSRNIWTCECTRQVNLKLLFLLYTNWGTNMFRWKRNIFFFQCVYKSWNSLS